MRKGIRQKRPMKAWLITRGAGPYAAITKGKGEIVDILSARKSVKDVASYVQRLHDLFCLTLRERANCARTNEPIYKVECHRTLSQSLHIYCGHDPCFAAQLVKDLVVERDDGTGDERVAWLPWAAK